MASKIGVWKAFKFQIESLNEKYTFYLLLSVLVDSRQKDDRKLIAN